MLKSKHDNAGNKQNYLLQSVFTQRYIFIVFRSVTVIMTVIDDALLKFQDEWKPLDIPLLSLTFF